MGDYYPLTPYSTDSGVWMAWQFDRPEAGEGMAQVWAKAASTTPPACRFEALDPDASYSVQNIDEESAVTVSGDLMEPGLQVTRPKGPVLWYTCTRKRGHETETKTEAAGRSSVCR